MRVLISFSLLIVSIIPFYSTFAEQSASHSWLDRSHSIFLPPDLKKKLGVHQNFPLFWWNFLVLETQDEKSDWEEASRTCAQLKELKDALIRVECEHNLKELQSYLVDWRRDYPLRYPRPSDVQIRASLDSSLAKASLPAGDPALLSMLRTDPLESWRELQELVEKRFTLKLTRKNGFFFDEITRRILIPIQMRFSPTETQKTAQFYASVSSRWGFLGPHASTLKNEEQVTQDTSQVSVVGTVILSLFGLGLFLTGRWRLLLLIPPVLIGAVIGGLATVAVFGSIHGLTLSFGAGIVGLALDYGLQAAFASTSLRIWRSNLFGLLTTIVGLLVLMFSGIPLLRQMMFFAFAGLVSAYVLLYVLFKRYPSFFLAPPFPLIPKQNRLKTGIVVLFILCAFIGGGTVRPNLDMRQFNFQEEKMKGVSEWFFKSQMSQPPLVRLHEGSSALISAHEERKWADDHRMKLENVANYLPLPELQQRNRSSWNFDHCRGFSNQLNDTQRKFFMPFLEEQLCHAPDLQLLEPGHVSRNYFAHLNYENEWITLFFPTNSTEESALRSQYPDVSSMREIVSIFPETFARELVWMAPLSLFLATALLVIYYRRASLVILALIPYMSGMGLVVAAKTLLGFDISFISIMALIMVFGLSIDYGIFATDVDLDKDLTAIAGSWTGMAFAAFTTVAGFVPMLFCKHPVLLHLGLTLFFGTVGTYIGAIWGIPSLRRFAKRRSSRAL